MQKRRSHDVINQSSFLRKQSASSIPSNNPANSSSSPKKSIPPPANIFSIILVFLMYIFKQPLLKLKIDYRAGIYLCLASAGALFFDLIAAKFRSSHAISSDSSSMSAAAAQINASLLNRLVLKFSLGWTLIVLVPFVWLSAYIYTNASHVKIVCRHLIRLAVLYSCWFACIYVFEYVENRTGACYQPITNLEQAHQQHQQTQSNSSVSIRYQKVEMYRTKQQCLRQNRRRYNAQHTKATSFSSSISGFVWNGFDISGHCFILLLCQFWILEECALIARWTSWGNAIVRECDSYEMSGGGVGAGESSNEGAAYHRTSDFNASASSSSASVSGRLALSQCKANYQSLTWILQLLICCSSILSILFDLGFLTTIVYFHTMPSKTLGTCVALLCWYASYKIVFPAIKCSPGDHAIFKKL